jgi:CO dehydrogenase/acetyl-CoA synthase alpha subunit
LLIAYGQSKKLADIRKKFQPDLPVEAVQRNSVPKKQLFTGLKPEIAEELSKANSLIDESINRIMRSFPEGKKNKLFSFRFGSVDAVKSMSIKDAFRTLGIDDNSVKMKLIADLNYHGNELKGS